MITKGLWPSHLGLGDLVRITSPGPYHHQEVWLLPEPMEGFHPKYQGIFCTDLQGGKPSRSLIFDGNISWPLTSHWTTILCLRERKKLWLSAPLSFWQSGVKLPLYQHSSLQLEENCKVRMLCVLNWYKGTHNAFFCKRGKKWDGIEWR